MRRRTLKLERGAQRALAVETFKALISRRVGSGRSAQLSFWVVVARGGGWEGVVGVSSFLGFSASCLHLRVPVPISVRSESTSGSV